MLQKIRDILRLNDLSDQEISVYVALLQVQKATIPMIREKSGLPNITVYRCMKDLEERGMVESEKLNRKQAVYMPLTLEKLIGKVAHAQKKLRRMELELRNLDSLIPYMNDLEHDEKPEIDLRLGFDAFREEYLKIPDAFADEYMHIGSFPKAWEIMKMNYDSPEERWFINRRMTNNLFTRVLNIPSMEAETVQSNDSREKRTTRLCATIPIKNDCLAIAKDQVTHFVNDPENPRVIIIRNLELVKAHNAQFEDLWREAA